MAKIEKGTWVEIERVVLQPAERAQNLPEDTKKTPYLMRLSGFLTADAEIGDEVTVKSLIGRKHQGMLKVVNPSYNHSFGPTMAELLDIGIDEEEA
ncbi:MAG TPA: 2-amino-4-oxopentanoate thiolase subunit OrtA [Anaerolineaceae bacterium]|jgi:hypothetical protein|nr:hypothetical protein [Chloroflexota bacterium]HPL81427.1 2-amino-4-oxopentanoate thiolase subunit OrtA [Anaerolineaceae bacterium]